MNRELLALAARLDATNAARAWHLALERVEKMQRDSDGNPKEMGADFCREFCSQMEAVQAERALDCMYTPQLLQSRAYVLLREKARAFIERFPQLLEMGWVHPAGAIDDLMQEMRMQRLDGQPKVLH